MTGLDPAIHVFGASKKLDVDARSSSAKTRFALLPGHDDCFCGCANPAYTPAMSSASKQVAIIGAGPAGLMAAEVLAQGGANVTVYDAMPSAGRKFLMAGTRRAQSHPQRTAA